MESHLAPHRRSRSPLALAGAALLVGALLAAAAAAAPPPAPDARARAAWADRIERSSRFTPPAARATPVLSEAALARLDAEGRSALWVLFTDKGVFDERGFDAAVRDAGTRLTERARARRALEQGGTYAPDFDDVPVPGRYVDAVGATGVSVRHVSKWLNAVSVMADESQARRIAALPFVRAIVPLRLSRRVAPVSVGPTTEGAPESQGAAPAPERAATPGGALAAMLQKPAGYGPSITQLTDIRVPAVHDSGYSGAGVILAMFDTGYNKSHSATIQLKRIAERDFIFHDGETANQAADAASQWDHGTGTWSVAGGYWPNNLIGPAYNATFALAKTEYVPSETPAEEDNWMAAAEWSDSLGVDVISSSLAYLDFDGTASDYTWSELDGKTTVVAQGALLAHRRGILLANAMGNEGPNGRTLWSPADVDSILSCGAVTSGSSYSIAVFSSRGNTADGRIKPEVVAQGVSTYWAVASNNTLITTAGGTSLSTPLVGGSAALVREAHPEWNVAQVRQALMTTADRAATPDSVYGWGRINVPAAIWTSAYGPPVFPRPFDLTVPPANSVVNTMPLTLRWHGTTDPQGEALSYTVTLRSLASNQVVFTKTTTDSSAVVTGYLGPSASYEWSVTATDLLAHGRTARQPFRFTTGATTDVAIPPASAGVVLGQNRPNPFLRATDIPFTLSGSGSTVPADLRIFDARGRLVKTLLDSDQPTARQYLIRWNGIDESGHPAAAGIYFYRLRAAGRELVRRLVLLR
jgi:serine protease AprX